MVVERVVHTEEEHVQIRERLSLKQNKSIGKQVHEAGMLTVCKHLDDWHPSSRSLIYSGALSLITECQPLEPFICLGDCA